MAKMFVAHHVADFDQWHTLFIEHGETRKRHGATGHTVTRTVADPNALVVVIDFATAAGAEAFAADPSLAEVMHRAGVDGPPTIYMTEVSSTVAY